MRKDAAGLRDWAARQENDNAHYVFRRSLCRPGGRVCGRLSKLPGEEKRKANATHLGRLGNNGRCICSCNNN